MKIISSFFIYIFLLITAFMSILAHASGGIALGTTRVIYPMNAKEASIQLINSDSKNKFLIQSWIDNYNGTKSTDFIITPPLFVSNPKTENTLRITYLGNELPQDRESLYWLNSKSVPSIDYDQVKDINVLQIAVLSRIKLFVRPENLPIAPDEARKELIFKKQNGSILIQNNSPYYITLVNLKIGDTAIESTMLPPKDHEILKVSDIKSTTISFQTINDYGALTPKTTVKLQ